jgi:uncharacterized protein
MIAGGIHPEGSDALLLVAMLVLVAFRYLNRPAPSGGRPAVSGDPSIGSRWRAPGRKAVPAAQHYVGAAILLAVVPILVARWLGFGRPAELGLGSGHPGEGALWLLVGIPVGLAVGRIAASIPAMRRVCPLGGLPRTGLVGFLPRALLEFLYYGAWEILFRGVLLFSLMHTMGAVHAIAVTTALSVVAHFGGPMVETVTAIPVGLLLGWIDLRIGAIWYLAVAHWLAGVSMDWWIMRSAA